MPAQERDISSTRHQTWSRSMGSMTRNRGKRHYPKYTSVPAGIFSRIESVVSLSIAWLKGPPPLLLSVVTEFAARQSVLTSRPVHLLQSFLSSTLRSSRSLLFTLSFFSRLSAIAPRLASSLFSFASNHRFTPLAGALLMTTADLLQLRIFHSFHILKLDIQRDKASCNGLVPT